MGTPTNLRPSTAAEDSESLNLIRKAIYLQYTLAFITFMMLISGIDVWVAKHFLPGPLFAFWKFAGRPTTLFAAGLSVKHALTARYQANRWGAQVARILTLTCWIAAAASFLPVYFPKYFPDTDAAVPKLIARIDHFVSQQFNPPPPLPQSITIENPYAENWFDQNGPRIWFARNPNGSLRYYRAAGQDPKDPVTGADLQPVSQEILAQAERSYDESKRRLQVQQEFDLRQSQANDAQRALDAGDYEEALKDCSPSKRGLHHDPCEGPYQEAARRKADVLVKQSEQEIQQRQFYSAARHAREALKYDPDSPNAKVTLQLAQAEQQLLEKGPSQ